jgi:hypothetical protein
MSQTYSEALKDWCLKRGLSLAVYEAIQSGAYTDKAGTIWRKGVDGWFMDHGGNDIYLISHGEMEKIIKEENP